MERDGYRKSLWQTTVGNPDGSTVDLPSGTMDVVVVGGGITGLSTALALQESGMKCLVLEARNIGFGTTGGTSAHINTFLDLPYDAMISKFGPEHAALVARAVVEATDRIRDQALRHAPDCNWKQQEAFLFATTEEEEKELERNVEASAKVGLDVGFVDTIPFPSSFRKAAMFRGQASFHPLRYLEGLRKAFLAAGGRLLEQCRVLGTNSGATLEVITERGTVQTQHLVYATHVPPGVNVLHFRNAPYRSYILSARLKPDAVPPDALVYDMQDPYHYYRTEEVEGERLLIAGGCDHKTGEEKNTEQRARELEAHVRSLFPVEEITHSWSAQYFEPSDGLPYIGRLPMSDDRIHVATGYNGNGITLGTLASIILTDLIGGREGPYAELFDPSRVSIVAGFRNFVKEAVDVVGHLAAAPFPNERLHELADLAKGEGRLVQYAGRSMGIFRDEHGKLHAVGSLCSHIKCSVAWNGAERSWDCPCHGSRFSITGEVLTAPARKPLQRIEGLE